MSQLSMAPQTTMVVATTNNWTITYLGPITTPWTRPPHCYETTTFDSDSNSMYIYDLLQGDDWNCMPPLAGKDSGISSSSPIFPGVDGSTLLYYSPANCPEGWTIAATNVQSEIGDVTACSAFSFGYNLRNCERSRPAGSPSTFTITNVMFVSDRDQATPTWTTVVMTTGPTWMAIWAYPIHIMANPPVISPTVTNSIPPPTSTSMVSGSAVFRGKGLSKGPRIGIGLGAVFVVFFFIVGICLFLRKRGQKHQTKNIRSIQSPRTMLQRSLRPIANQNQSRQNRSPNEAGIGDEKDINQIQQEAPKDSLHKHQRRSFSRDRNAPNNRPADSRPRIDSSGVHHAARHGNYHSTILSETNTFPISQDSDYRFGSRIPTMK